MAFTPTLVPSPPPDLPPLFASGAFTPQHFARALRASTVALEENPGITRGSIGSLIHGTIPEVLAGKLAEDYGSAAAVSFGRRLLEEMIQQSPHIADESARAAILHVLREVLDATTHYLAPWAFIAGVAVGQQRGKRAGRKPARYGKGESS